MATFPGNGYFPQAPCPFAGFQWEGHPKGPDSIDENNYPCYQSRANPRYWKNCGLILFPDAKGIWHNSRVLADQFAEAGYHVVVIDIWNVVRAEGQPYTAPTPQDNPLPSGEQMGVMVANATQYLVDHLCERIGLVGYSEGASFVLRILEQGTGVLENLSAAFLATPRGEYINLQAYTRVQVPVSIAFADNDTHVDAAARRVAEQGLRASNQPYQISLCSHVHDGFAVRRAYRTDAEVFAKKQAFIQAITWFQEHLVDERCKRDPSP